MTTAPNPVPGEPSPGAPTKDEKLTAQIVWVLDVFVQVLGPYLMWRLQAKDSRFVAHHAKACINHTLTVMVYVLVVCIVFGGIIWAVVAVLEPAGTDEGLLAFVLGVSVVAGLWGLLLFGLGILSLVVHVIALFKIGAGEWYVPPLCWRFVKLEGEPPTK